MVKRRQKHQGDEGREDSHDTQPAGNIDDFEMDDKDDQELINVDFEFFDPQELDFHGIKLLLRQLFDVDSVLLDLSALADVILEQKLVGSTIKVDGREGDPYSFLTVINLKIHQKLPCVQSLLSYLKDRSEGTSLETSLASVFAGDTSGNTAIVLSERLLNMPSEVSPPSYKMLLEEIELAIEDKEPYFFDHFLIISKAYAEIESKIDAEDTRPSKRQRSSKNSSHQRIFDFHAEDDIFLREAQQQNNLIYRYKQEQPESLADSKRAFQDFGVLPKGRIILLDRKAFISAVEAMQSLPV